MKKTTKRGENSAIELTPHKKGGRIQVEKRRTTGDARMEQSLQHTDRTRGEREREQESAKAFPFQTSLRTSIDLALGLGAEALFQQLC